MKIPPLFGCLILFITGTNLFAQTSTTKAIPYTAIPSLTFSPDARSSAMGEAGVASSPDANAAFWNASKLSFAERDFGVSATYTPWLRTLIDGMWLGYASVYKKIGSKQAIAGSVNYFRQDASVTGGSKSFSDLSLNATYSRQLGKNFGMGLTLKYISSDLAGQGYVPYALIKKEHVLAADISAFYRKTVFNDLNGRNLTYTLGAVLSNLGGKIDYGPAYVQGFIPTTFKLGGGISFSPNDRHKFNFIVDAGKLLIPTRSAPNYANNQSALQGIFKSFSDAPGGFREELEEVQLGFGGEYWYKSVFTLRGGYHTENKNKGSHRYGTVGAGLLVLKRYSADFSYILPFTEGSPWNETMRFTLSMYL